MNTPTNLECGGEVVVGDKSGVQFRRLRLEIEEVDQHECGQTTGHKIIGKYQRNMCECECEEERAREQGRGRERINSSGSTQAKLVVLMSAEICRTSKVC